MKNIRDELDNLKRIVTMIAAHLGPSCEVVLHDLTKGYESTIVDIVNGHITSRSIGDCGTNLGLEVLRGTAENGDRYNYITQNREGRILRSSTVHLRDDNNKIIGAICVNYDITDLIQMEKTMQQVTRFSFNDIDKNERFDEYFVNNIADLITTFLNECQSRINKPVALMNREDKIDAIDFLDKKGVFLITKAGDRICEFLNISKHTLYQYLDIARNRAPKSGPEIS